MKRTIPAIAIAALCCAPVARAQDGADNLRAALSILPATIFLTSAPEITNYLDLSVLADANGGVLERDGFIRARTGAGLRPIDALIQTGPEEWSDRAGVDIGALRFVAGYGQPPRTVAIWGFADDATAADAFAGLRDTGFAPVGILPGVIANGEPGRMDIARRDPADPWTGMLGQTSVVTVRGPTFLHAIDAAAFAPILGASATMADSAPGQTLLAGLEAQEGAVLQAMFFGPVLGFHGGIDPALLLMTDLDEARAAIEEAMAQPPVGVPFYSGAVIADLETADGPVALLALAYGDCASAEAAAAQMATLWPQVEGAEVTAAPSHVATESAGCAAVVTVPGGENNVQFGRAVNAMMQRDFAPIRVGVE